ncbi:MAG: hypothetical protein NC078_12995 [Ruminococcus sp.]|nr:hypothetical protein [Ruminococcus sp.]
MDFEKYKSYLISNWLPEYEALHSERDLRVEGWNMLLDEFLSPLIEKELGLRYIGRRIWADDYCGHRRRVLSLFQQTDLGGSFKWGWNFDFVPKLSGEKAVYARTDKGIYTHFFENIHVNHNESVKGTEAMFFDRLNIDTADYENSMKKKVKEHTDAFYETLPLIRAFYDETETYEQTLEMMYTLFQSNYYRLIQGYSLFLTKIFLQQYIEANEDNEKDLREFFSNDSTRESFLKKFYKIPKDYKS